MKKTFRKVMALLLVVMIIITAVPMTAFSADTTHSHPMCGSSCRCTDKHSNLTWTAWDGTTRMYNGNYYLEKDIVLSSTMILDYSYVSYLCLNGHSITCEDMVFDIYSNRTLMITDCVGTGKIDIR